MFTLSYTPVTLFRHKCNRYLEISGYLLRFHGESVTGGLQAEADGRAKWSLNDAFSVNRYIVPKEKPSWRSPGKPGMTERQTVREIPGQAGDDEKTDKINRHARPDRASKTKEL